MKNNIIVYFEVFSVCYSPLSGQSSPNNRQIFGSTTIQYLKLCNWGKEKLHRLSSLIRTLKLWIDLMRPSSPISENECHFYRKEIDSVDSCCEQNNERHFWKFDYIIYFFFCSIEQVSMEIRIVYLNILWFFLLPKFKIFWNETMKTMNAQKKWERNLRSLFTYFHLANSLIFCHIKSKCRRFTWLKL